MNLNEMSYIKCIAVQVYTNLYANKWLFGTILMYNSMGADVFGVNCPLQSIGMVEWLVHVCTTYNYVPTLQNGHIQLCMLKGPELILGMLK